MEINVTIPEENEKRITTTDLKPALMSVRNEKEKHYVYLKKFRFEAIFSKVV